MFMKRSLIAIVSLLLFAVAGCSSMNLSSSTSPVTDRILASGELRVGMSGNQPPFNMKNRAGKLMGMDVDLAVGLARTMGVEVKLVSMPFQELLPALEKGEIDIVLSGMTMTTERNLEVAFAGPYFISGKAALTKSPSLAAANEPSDVNKKARMTVLAGSTSELFAKRSLPNVELSPDRRLPGLYPGPLSASGHRTRHDRIDLQFRTDRRSPFLRRPLADQRRPELLLASGRHGHPRTLAGTLVRQFCVGPGSALNATNSAQSRARPIPERQSEWRAMRSVQRRESVRSTRRVDSRRTPWPEIHRTP